MANPATHVFLLIGQSNMVGRDAPTSSPTPDSRIFNFLDGRSGTALNKIEIAKDPLRHDKTGVVYGVGPGLSFAQTLLPTLPVGDRILLVNRAWGGTPICEWRKTHESTGYSSSSGYDLPINPYMTALGDYQTALVEVKAAGGNPLKAGILWLQGESDVDFLTPPETYYAEVCNMLTLMRGDMGEPTMKIVIAEFYQNYGGQTGKQIRDTLPCIAKELNAGFSHADGCSVLADGVHMTKESLVKIGTRMAQSYRALK